ncbi:MAG: hypothetical protein ACK5RA_03255 [Cyanobacteriota bacterium]|jgi:hypothetical protein
MRLLLSFIGQIFLPSNLDPCFDGGGIKGDLNDILVLKRIGKSYINLLFLVSEIHRIIDSLLRMLKNIEAKSLSSQTGRTRSLNLNSIEGSGAATMIEPD